MNIEGYKNKYDINKAKLPNNPSCPIYDKPNIQKMIEQGTISQTQLWVIRHLATALGIFINNDPYTQQGDIETDLYLELAIPNPIHKAYPYQSDAFLPKNEAQGIADNYVIEIDSVFHDGEIKEHKDKFKDEVADRVCNFQTIRQRVDVPDELRYGNITNPRKREIVKYQYQELYLQEPAGYIAKKIRLDWLKKQSNAQNTNLPN